MRALGALLAAALATAALADTVALPEKIELTGKKIEILEIRDDEVVVRVPYGDIVVPRSRVVEMKVDFKERLARLMEEGRDTVRALYNLGRVCAQLEMKKEATRAFLEAIQRDEIPEDLLLPLATELEKCEQWAAAGKCYAAYLRLHPDDAKVKARAEAAAIKAATSAPQAKLPAPGDVEIKLSQAPKVATGVPQQPTPQQPTPQKPPAQQPPQQQQQPQQKPPAPGVEEGLEADPGWTSEAWGSSVDVNVGAPEGTNDKLLRVFLAGAEQDKANVVLEQNFDLSDKKELTLDVYNLGKQAVTVAVAFTTLPGWKFYESVPKTVLPTGQTPKRLVFDLTSNKFKCAETNWRYKSPIQNKNKVGKMYLLIYTRQTGSWIFFNNIRFTQVAPQAPAPAAGGPAPAAKP